MSGGPGRLYRVVAVLTALSGASLIVLGALSAHRLEGTAQHLCDSGLRYQAWHTLALLAVLLAGADRWQWWRAVCVLWIVGTALFSGSLYIMAATGWRLGLVTPCGGLVLMAGWLWLARQWWCLTRCSRVQE